MWCIVDDIGVIVGEVGFFYKSSVALGCLILMLASVACTGWFFYSWLGGVPGLFGAGVGCAVQIMAYGFSGVIVHQERGLPKLVLTTLIASALALSILSSYATLNGYFNALQAQSEAQTTAAEQKDLAIQAALAQRMQVIESMSRDVEIGSAAANQGLDDKYRTQANQFLKNNEATRNALVEQIDKVETLVQSDLLAEPEKLKASPIDGLSGLLGGQSTAIMVLCIWLALMFDALPIVGITLFEARARQKKASKVKEQLEASLITSELTPENTAPRALLEELGDPILIEDDSHQHVKENDLRLFTNICCKNLAASKEFYTQLLDLEIKYDSDWFVQLGSPSDPNIEFGLIQHDHELIPNSYQNAPNGMYITFVVPDVDTSYERALDLGAKIIQEPRNEFYGQRRFLLKEPSGCLVDISSPWDEEAEVVEAEEAMDFREREKERELAEA